MFKIQSLSHSYIYVKSSEGQISFNTLASPSTSNLRLPSTFNQLTVCMMLTLQVLLSKMESIYLFYSFSRPMFLVLLLDRQVQYICPRPGQSCNRLTLCVEHCCFCRRNIINCSSFPSKQVHSCAIYCYTLTCLIVHEHNKTCISSMLFATAVCDIL